MKDGKVILKPLSKAERVFMQKLEYRKRMQQNGIYSPLLEAKARYFNNPEKELKEHSLTNHES